MTFPTNQDLVDICHGGTMGYLISLSERARQHRIENRERSEELSRKCDAERDLEQLVTDRHEAILAAGSAQAEMNQAKQRMERELARAEELRRQIEAAKFLLGARRG